MIPAVEFFAGEGAQYPTTMTCETLSSVLSSSSWWGESPTLLAFPALPPPFPVPTVPFPSQFPGPLNTREAIKYLNQGCEQSQVAPATALHILG